MTTTPSRVAGVLLVVVGLVFPLALFAEAEQPAVAIEEPKVGKKVSRDARRHLDIESLWAELESAFRATGKLRVLGRDAEATADPGEEQRPAGSDAVEGNAMATGEISRPKYLVRPRVQDFAFTRLAKPLPNFASKYRLQDSGLLQLNVQMVDATRGEIRATFDLSSRFATRSRVVNTNAGAPSSEHFTEMAKDVAAQLADQFVTEAFPMKVVKRTRGDQVIINRGEEGGMELGEILKVFFAAGELIDPDTGRSLGPSEEYVGTVQVVHISPTVTYAKIVSEADPLDAPIKGGDIVRRARTD